jgi:hypothetical protein
VTQDSFRIHGGYGYSKEYEIERLMREAPFLLIGEGTSEIQKTSSRGGCCASTAALTACRATRPFTATRFARCGTRFGTSVISRRVGTRSSGLHPGTPVAAWVPRGSSRLTTTRRRRA